MEVPQCPVQGCTIPVDLVLQSSDGQTFGAHKNNLQAYGDGFPLSDSVVVTGVVNDIPLLSEDAVVVLLMLCFMHRAVQPDLEKLPFDTVARFADAAEKYFIYSAMGVCKFYMSHQVQVHPAAVLGYACKNHYDDLANQAAPLTLEIDLKTVSTFLGPAHMLQWFKYRERYLEDFRLIQSYVPGIVGLHKGGLVDCGLWTPFELAVLRRLLKVTKIADAQNARGNIIDEEMGPLKECARCNQRAERWRWHSTSAAKIEDVLWTAFKD